MPTYLIVEEMEDRGKHSGVILGKKEAANPEDAINEVAKDIIEDFGIVALTPSPESRIGFALLLLHSLSPTPTERVTVYRLGEDPDGNPDKYGLNDLEFDSEDIEEQMENMEDIDIQ